MNFVSGKKRKKNKITGPASAARAPRETWAVFSVPCAETAHICFFLSVICVTIFDYCLSWRPTIGVLTKKRKKFPLVRKKVLTPILRLISEGEKKEE